MRTKASKTQQGGPPEIDFPCPPRMRRWLGQLLEWVVSQQPIQGIGTTIDDSPRGRVINAAGGGGGVADEFHPFELVVTGQHKVRVVFGTVNSEIPTGMSEGDEPIYELTVAGTGVIYLLVTTDANGDVTSVTIATASSMPPDALGSWKMMIGSFTHVSGQVQVAQNISGSQAIEVCGGVDANWGLV